MMRWQTQLIMHPATLAQNNLLAIKPDEGCLKLIILHYHLM